MKSKEEKKNENTLEGMKNKMKKWENEIGQHIQESLFNAKMKKKKRTTNDH